MPEAISAGLEMEFDFSYRKVQEWQAILARAFRPNWLQSLPYAIAVRLFDRKITRHALLKIEGRAVGMMAIQEIRLGPIHVVYLYRGPLFFEKNPPDRYLELFTRAFAQHFPRRLLRKRLWIAEWQRTPRALEILTRNGFKKKLETYQTIWLDLRKSEATLRKELSPKWRGHLSKAERSDAEIRIDSACSSADRFLDLYVADKKAKGYKGRSREFVKREIATALLFKEATIFWAQHDGQDVAAILILHHGSSATYRIGFTSAAGRKVRAHHLLIWNASLYLKKIGMKSLDLGGVEPSTAQGVTQFKAGMGGESFQLVGVFS